MQEWILLDAGLLGRWACRLLLLLEWAREQPTRRNSSESVNNGIVRAQNPLHPVMSCHGEERESKHAPWASLTHLQLQTTKHHGQSKQASMHVSHPSISAPKKENFLKMQLF
jgi:hypothetical protein